GLWDLNAHTETTTGALTVNSGGQVTAGGGNLSVGALTVNGSVNTGGGNLTGTTLALTAGSIATGAGTYNLGGDVTLTGASSASTISGILALGTAVRTFTIADGAAATDMDLQAQITSGAGGGITKAGPGLIQLSGANTYSGDTTISAGTLKLATGGTLANTPNITVASGATFDVSTPTTALALGAGQTLKASATGGNTTATITVASSKNLTLGGGLAFTALGSANTIAPLTVAGTAGSLDLNNNPVTVTTTTALTAGSYKLIAKSGSATVTGTPGTLTVNGSSTAAGTATPTLRVTSGELYLDVYPAALTLGNNGPICAGSTLNLTANAVSGGTYAWTGPSFTSSLQNPSIANATTAVSATYHCTITVNGLTSADATTLATVNALPTITLGSSPTVSYGTTSANLPYSATGNGANQYIITYDSTAHTAGFTDGGSFAALPSSPIAITVPASAPIATYNGTITVKNSATGCTSSGTAFTVTVIKATPTIGGVTASPSISYGTANVSLSGTVSAGSGYPADGETVSVTINGNTQNASIAGGAGGFSISFPTATIPPSPTAYTINYAYAGNAAGANTLNAATPDTSTALTVTGIKVPVLTYANASGIGRQITLAEIQTAGLASSQVSPTYTITLPSASSFLGGSVITNGAGTIILCEPSSTPGSDHFDYTVSDGVSSATATVNITFTNAVSVSKPEISVGVGGVVNGTMYGIPGVQYDVQRSTTASGTYTTLTANLTPPNPIQAASDGKISFQDTAPPLGSGFYRTIQH
ncbi:MAG: autotransporter-associated beta strand repeat-containing protein, partial [Verrucomicrobiae bacterium]